MRPQLRKGIFRLVIVTYGAWLAGLVVLALYQYQNKIDSIFVSVDTPAPKVTMADIAAYQLDIRSKLANREKNLGEPETPHSDGQKASDALIDQMVKERNSRIETVMQMIEKKKQPFTDDYIDQIAQTTKIPQSIVRLHPEQAEKVYRLVQLQLHAVDSPFLRMQIEDRPSSARLSLGALAFFALVLPAMLVAIGGLIIAIATWVKAGFSDKGSANGG